MPPGIVPFDANIMPFFQMAYAAAAARYPHAVVPPLPARSPDAPPSILNPYTSDRSTTFNPNTTPSNLGQPTDLPAGDQATHQTNPANVKSAAGPVVVQKAGKQVFVPQQKAARLERHPVLGRLQLKSTAKPHVATSTGLESNYVAETNISVRDDQHKTAPAVARTARLPNSSTNAAPSSGPADEAAQRQQKKRLVWTQELHERFVKAINAVGINSAVPKTIVTIMNVDGLTTEHVKSHLQKYRNSMRKEAAEEERDRSGGAGPSSDLRHHQFGAPSTNGAQAIQTPVFPKPPGDTNRSSQVIREVATNPARNQTLPFLPSRIMALGGQVREILRPGVNTGSSKEITNSVSTPKSETNSVSHMPPPPSPKSPSKEDRACHRAGSSDAVPPVVAKKVRMAASAPQERRQNDTIKCSTREASLENAGPEGNANTTDDIMTGKNAARNDRGGEQGLPTAAVIGATEQDQRASVIKQSTNSVADISTLQNSRFETIAQAGDPQKSATTATKANARVENAPSASQDNRDLELELMKEETQQMQLQVQMMVYRTIAMEKKLEEIHSGRLNAEVSGRVDSSKRSTGGDATPLVASTGDNETQGEEVYKSEGAENAKETENVIVAKEIREPADGHKQKQSDVGTKKRPRSLASEGQTEVEALLGEQMGLQKRLENASALIDKRMKIDDDHDFVNQNRRGLKRDDTSAATGMIDGNDGKKNNERAGAKVACRQGRNG